MENKFSVISQIDEIGVYFFLTVLAVVLMESLCAVLAALF